MADRYLQDYVVGDVMTYGPIGVTEDDVVEFGRRYDPQPFHVDRAAAAQGPYGGLIASGWHTCAMMMSLLAKDYLSPASSLGSPGVDELRWLLPVRPGDVLMLRTTVEQARASASKPDRGVIHTSVELTNAAGDTVLSCRAINLVRTRPAA